MTRNLVALRVWTAVGEALWLAADALRQAERALGLAADATSWLGHRAMDRAESHANALDCAVQAGHSGHDRGDGIDWTRLDAAVDGNVVHLNVADWPPWWSGS